MIELKTEFTKDFVNAEELASIAPEAEAAYNTLVNGSGAGNDFLGWVDLPVNYDKDEFARIIAAAERIKKSCDIFVVIGIGGSYLGARAAIEFVKSPMYNALAKDTPEIYFAGNSISAASLSEIVALCEGKDVCINVISKSGTTTEPAIAFRVLREMLEAKYGKEGARERTFITTDKQRGALKTFADASGYETFVIPDDVGGRYSVLTAVGLLPIAVSGADISLMMQGAAEAREKFMASSSIDKNDAVKYAAYRNVLYRKGKAVEMLTAYEGCMLMMNEWWKQLFGESEGKDGRGIFPASAIFSTDLHSMGQYIQEGERVLFETVVNIKDSGSAIAVPNDAANVDGLNFLSGRKFDDINHTAMLGTLFAHTEGGVPNMIINLPDRSEKTCGELFYFFEAACAVSGYMLGVNPFNQPGVEAYKKNMFALLGKSGYEKEKAALEAKMEGMSEI